MQRRNRRRSREARHRGRRGGRAEALELAPPQARGPQVRARDRNWSFSEPRQPRRGRVPRRRFSPRREPRAKVAPAARVRGHAVRGEEGEEEILDRSLQGRDRRGHLRHDWLQARPQAQEAAQERPETNGCMLLHFLTFVLPYFLLFGASVFSKPFLIFFFFFIVECFSWLMVGGDNCGCLQSP